MVCFGKDMVRPKLMMGEGGGRYTYRKAPRDWGLTTVEVDEGDETAANWHMVICPKSASEESDSTPGMVKIKYWFDYCGRQRVDVLKVGEEGTVEWKKFMGGRDDAYWKIPCSSEFEAAELVTPTVRDFAQKLLEIEGTPSGS
jgi:hypothetical protein